MKRSIFIRSIVIFFIATSTKASAQTSKTINTDTREYWVSVLTKIADPVLVNLSQQKLRANMPVEMGKIDRKSVTHLEAFGRLLAGLAPWLELGEDNTQEGKLRKKYIALTKQSIAVAVNPTSPDFLNFTNGRQPLVDAAFLAHGLLRGYHQLWLPLSDSTKAQTIRALKSTRIIVQRGNNWELFSAMVEAFIFKVEGTCKFETIDTAFIDHEKWYKGDGTYGDGANFHWDYYNSFVIQPMMLDIAKLLLDNSKISEVRYKVLLNRAVRYAVIQERFISPEGTYPPIGRSLAYRFGAFQMLAQIALQKQLPTDIKPNQVRSALSAVIKRSISAPNTFDKNGWLQIGLAGHQPSIGEGYISTGSLYLCSVGMLPLGLPANDVFWSAPTADWTSKKVWNGIDIAADHSIK
jgi:hypothetical protein